MKYLFGITFPFSLNIVQTLFKCRGAFPFGGHERCNQSDGGMMVTFYQILLMMRDTVGMLLLINVGRGSWQGGAYVGCTKHLEVAGKK